MSKHFQRVAVQLKRYRIGNREIRVHHRSDNDDVVQAWMYENGTLADTILSIEKDKKAKVVRWFFEA